MNTGVFALDTNLMLAVDARRFLCAMQETTGGEIVVTEQVHREACSLVLVQVKGGKVIEVRRRGRPVARIVPLPSAAAPPSDWSHAEKRLQAVYPTPAGGTTAAQTIADGRGER